MSWLLVPNSINFPSSKTKITSASSMVLSLWAMTIFVLVALSFFSDLAILDSVTASKADVASSNKSIGAGLRKARASAIRCFCPPDNWLPFGPTGFPCLFDKSPSIFASLRLNDHLLSSRWVSIPNVVF